jgi:competence protein ComEC
MWAASAAGGALWGLWSSDPTELAFLAVGQGDCAVFRHRGTTILIDAGPAVRLRDRAPIDAGERIVIPKLRRMGVQSVDLILITHPDADHLGGLAAVLRAYPRARVATPALFRGHQSLKASLASAARGEDDVWWLSGRNEGTLGDFRIRLSCPPLAPGEDDNDGSLFAKFWSGASSVALTGDAGAEVEGRMARFGGWASQIAKCGHHGSKTSSSEEWLRAVRPQVAVVSCGRANRYGHPHASVLERLARHGARVDRTDRDGDLRYRPTPAGFVREP